MQGDSKTCMQALTWSSFHEQHQRRVAAMEVEGMRKTLRQQQPPWQPQRWWLPWQG